MGGRRLIWFLLGAAFLGGCGASECLDNQNSRPNSVFLASGGDVTGETLKIDSLTVVGIDAPGGVPLVENASVTGLTLPFRLGEDETRYVFEYGGPLKGVRDTLTFTYTPRAEFVSAACGALYVFDDVEARTTRWVIDSVSLPWRTINNVERDYIRIYFRVADEE